jgi:hypothetical protein
VTDHESTATDTADPAPQEPRPQSDELPKRPWWKSPVGVAGAAIILAVIGVGVYLGVDTVLAHPSSQATSPSTTASAPDQVPGLPPGAAACPRVQTDVQVPFNAGARGTPATSCGFVEQVRKEYSAHSTPTSGPSEVSAISPATFKWYKLVCFNSGTYVTCTGGAAAVIYLYNTADTK